MKGTERPKKEEATWAAFNKAAAERDKAFSTDGGHKGVQQEVTFVKQNKEEHLRERRGRRESAAQRKGREHSKVQAQTKPSALRKSNC